jgi:RNA polymerase sigma-70 factor (ECF subfamily)
VWRVVRGLGVPESDLDDVCQETFLIVHRKLAQFEGRSSLRTWICGIAVRVASDHRRKLRRRRDVPTEHVPDQVVHATQHDAIERTQAWTTLMRLLSDLREEQRQVFVLYELEGLTMREVAEAVGCPLSTAYARLEVAQKHVNRAMRVHAGQETGT